MELLLPNLGLIVWTTLAFLIVFLLLAKFAWKPILKSLKEREDFIQTSLNNAQFAQEKLQKVEEEIKSLLKDAQTEKNKILTDAQLIKTKSSSKPKKSKNRSPKNHL